MSFKRVTLKNFRITSFYPLAVRAIQNVSVTDGRTKKYNHVSITGFVQTGIYRYSTRDISGESYIIRKWQKRVPRGPLLITVFSPACPGLLNK